MRLNRDVLITGIVRHQNVFFALLDHIDKNDGSLEFPEFLYLNLYSKVICEDSTPNIQTHLSTLTLPYRRLPVDWRPPAMTAGEA